MTTRTEQARNEMTRDPIFLLQRRVGRDKWYTESVWLTRAEAECHGRANAHNMRSGWQVYCVPAGGELARLLACTQPLYPDPGPALCSCGMGDGTKPELHSVLCDVRNPALAGRE